MYTIYGKQDCPYCKMAVDLVKDESPCTFIDIEEDFWSRNFIKNTFGAKTVPQIFDGETHVGGYEDMIRYVARKTFDEGNLF